MACLLWESTEWWFVVPRDMLLQVWVHSQFGGVREAFNAIDSDHTRFITNAEFTAALQRFGFQRPTKQLFSHLDKDGSSRIVER